MYAFEKANVERHTLNEIIMSLSGSRFDEAPKLLIVSASFLQDILSVILNDAWGLEETTQNMIKNDSDVLVSMIKINELKPIYLSRVYHHIFRLYDEKEASDICDILKFICVDYFHMSGFETIDADYSASSMRQNLSLKPYI